MKINVLLTILILLHVAGRATSQSVQHTYRFYQELTVAPPECGPNLSQVKSAGTCAAPASPGEYVNELVPCGARRPVYHTNMHWGLAYANDGGVIGETYTIQMYVRVTDWGPTRTRIIDFSNGTTDEGIYFTSKNGSGEKCIDLYPVGPIGECPFFDNSTYHLLTITRDGATGIVEIYVDDKLFTSYNDAQGRYVGKAGVPVYVFRDDAVQACESGAANFAYLAFNNRHITKQEVEYSFREVCFIANVNSYADFSISPNPSCGYPKNITVRYTGPIPAPGTGYTFEWEWDGARVISGSGMGPYVVSWDSGGSKDVALTVSSNTCGNPRYNRKQAIIDSVDVNATIVSGSCETGSNGTVTLSGTQGLRPYLYSLDSTNYQPDSVFQMGVGAHRVWIKDGNGCAVGKTIQVEFRSDITVQTIQDTTICFGEAVTLSTNGNGQQFTWLPATGLDNAATKDPVARPETSIDYIVRASKGFCSLTDTVRIEVSPKIELRVTPDSQVDYNVPFQLYASSPQITSTSEASFVWSPPNGLNNPNSASPIAILRDDQSYSVEVTTGLGCKASGSVNLSIRRNESINIPSAFSPNGDGKNEVLMPVLYRIQSVNYFKIYNRWGQLVFFTTEMNKAWDGRYKDALPITGTYVWEIEGITETGGTIHRRGTVMLLQ